MGPVPLEENTAVTRRSAVLRLHFRMLKIVDVNALPIKPITCVEAGRLIEAANCNGSVG